MGYTTDFTGRLEFNAPILPQHYAYLKAFSHIRHMKRDNAKLKGEPDPIREQVGLPLGNEGEYFIGLPEDISCGWGYGQDNNKGLIDNNTPAGQISSFSSWEENRRLVAEGKAQPGLWCKWEVVLENNVVETGPVDAPENVNLGNTAYLQWSGAEKFYDYVEWMQYLINHFIGPWGYFLNGRIKWQGEETGDTGMIEVADNVITVTTLDDDLNKVQHIIKPKERKLIG